MSKSVIAGIIALAAVVAAGAAYFLMAVDDAALAQRAIQGSGSATCTFTEPETGAEATLYARAGDMRIVGVVSAEELGDFADTDITSNMLLLGETVYVWEDGSAQGFQFPVEVDETTTVEENPAALREVDEAEFERQTEELDFNCTRGAAAGMFEVPDDVEFLDFADLMQPPLDNDGTPETNDDFDDFDVFDPTADNNGEGFPGEFIEPQDTDILY